MESARTRILQAALELFSERGYVGATTREISRRADIAEITLFRHFPSKEKLFEEVVSAYLPSPEFGEVMTRARELPYRDALALIAGAFLEELRAREDLILIMYSESQRHSELMERIYKSLVDNLVSLLAGYFGELQRAGAVREFDVRAGAGAFLGMWFALYEAGQLSPGSSLSGPETAGVAREYIEIFVRGTQESGGGRGHEV
ncbi:MAG TPA: TetR/AcrR family transcriptional regulator [Bacillota bacterium]|nr:TetR/AcrR family transcriptional regulator [Bacillota bacterium]